MAGTPFAYPDFTHFEDLFAYANTVTTNSMGVQMFGVVGIGMTFLLLMLATKNYGTEKSLIFAGGFSTVLSVLGSGFGMVNPIVIAPFLILTIAGIILDWRNGQ